MEDFFVNGRGGLPKSHSFATFYSITVAAKHLAVFCDGSATVTPCKSGKTKCARFEKRNVQKSGKTKRAKNFAHTTL